MFKIILLILIIFGLNACKGEDMNNNEDTNKDIKMVYTPNGGGIKLNTKTNEFYLINEKTHWQIHQRIHQSPFRSCQYSR